MRLPNDYAPRLATLARARRRQKLVFTLAVMLLPALSFSVAPVAAKPHSTQTIAR